jgi:hypothetical protein
MGGHPETLLVFFVQHDQGIEIAEYFLGLFGLE